MHSNKETASVSKAFHARPLRPNNFRSTESRYRPQKLIIRVGYNDLDQTVTQPNLDPLVSSVYNRPSTFMIDSRLMADLPEESFCALESLSMNNGIYLLNPVNQSLQVGLQTINVSSPFFVNGSQYITDCNFFNPNIVTNTITSITTGATTTVVVTTAITLTKGSFITITGQTGNAATALPNGTYQVTSQSGTSIVLNYTSSGTVTTGYGSLQSVSAATTLIGGTYSGLVASIPYQQPYGNSGGFAWSNRVNDRDIGCYISNKDILNNYMIPIQITYNNSDLPFECDATTQIQLVLVFYGLSDDERFADRPSL